MKTNKHSAVRSLLFILTIMAFSGCQDQLVYIGDVSDEDKAAVIEAIEDEDSTPTISQITTFKIQYGSLPEGKRGRAHAFSGVACTIIISNSLEVCEVGGRARRMYISTRHELRHCEGQTGHSDDPTNLMYSSSPCWPESW